MKRNLIFALAAVLAFTFASCSKSTSTESIDQEARWFVSARGDYACDLLSDSVDVFQLFPEKYLDPDPDDYLEPLCSRTAEQCVVYSGVNPIVRDLADYYNALIMFSNCISDSETAERFGEDDPNVYSTMADSIALLDVTVIRNDTLRQLMKQVRSSMESYVRHMPKSKSDKVEQSSDKLFEYLNTKVNPIIESTRDAYWAYDARKPFYDNFDSILVLRGKSNKAYQQELLTQIHLAKTPAERHIYAIEFAHSDSANAHFLPGAAVLNREFVEIGLYSPYLSEMWRTWRASVSTLMGASSWSYIPNLHYNIKRRQIAEIIIKQIEEHPDDILAQGVLIDLAGMDNISRYGSLFGNAAMLEQMTMFPEWKLRRKGANNQ